MASANAVVMLRRSCLQSKIGDGSRQKYGTQYVRSRSIVIVVLVGRNNLIVLSVPSMCCDVSLM